MWLQKLSKAIPFELYFLIRKVRVNSVLRNVVAFCLFFFFFSQNIKSQEESYSFIFKKLTLSQIFQEIEKQTPYRFFYNDELVRYDEKLNYHFSNIPLKEILEILLQDLALSYKILEKHLVVITPDESKRARNVKGWVYSNTGEPMIGVNVIIKGTSRGTVTNTDGMFVLERIYGNTLLSFSYVGYISQDVFVNPGSEIKIIMEQDLAELEQVVVIGYSQMKRSDLTGSISSISKRDIESNKSANIIECIQGKVAGVNITRMGGNAGADLDIIIRGNKSLGEGGASNDPLFVVDGIPYFGNFILNPYDIESIEVLKDASSTAIYGVSGANGVVLITTKKGNIEGSKISFNAYTGLTSKLGNLPYANRDYYIKKKYDLVRKIENNPYLTDEQVTKIGIPLDVNEIEYWDNQEDFNWYEQFIKKNGSIQDYNLNFSGGNNNILYSSSFSYYDEKSLIERDYLKRYTIMLNAQSDLNRFFSAGATFIGGKSDINRGSMFKNDLLKVTPLVPATDSNGNYITHIANERVNPYLLRNATTNEIEELNIFATYFMQLNITENLFFRSTINLQYQNIEDGYARDKIEEANKEAAYADLQTERVSGLLQNNIFSFNKSWSNHKINFIGGFEYQKNITKKNRIFTPNLLTGNSKWYNLTQADENDIIIQLNDPNDLPYSKESLLSYFGRMRYQLKDKYIFIFSGRYDGASQLSKNNKWNFLPSISFAWKINEEYFLKNNPVVSNLKLRIGYGVVGNRSIPPYSSLAKINQSPLYIEFGTNEDIELGYMQVELGNENLTWEKTKSLNIGLNYGFFKHRLNGSIDIYNSYTYNLLQERLFPTTSGYPRGYDNIGNVTNRGIEMALNGITINRKNIYSSVTLLFSSNKEEITELGDGRKEDVGKGWFVGQPVDVYYDYKFIGIWQSDEIEEANSYNKKPGDVKFLDRDNDGEISAEDDKMVIGTPRPDWTGGASFFLAYKNFDFSVSGFARIGQMIIDEAVMFWSPNGDEAGFALDYWTPLNPINTMPGLHEDNDIGTYNDLKPLQYTDGSYYKIKDIIIGYNIPDVFLYRYNITKLRFSLSLKNYFVFSKFFNKGRYDPEQGGQITFPMPRMASFGVNLDF